CRQDDSRGVAIEAELVRRVDGRPNDQSGPATLHGEAHGRENDRGKGKPPFPHLAARRDCKPDPGGGRTAVGRRLTGDLTQSEPTQYSKPNSILLSQTDNSQK